MPFIVAWHLPISLVVDTGNPLQSVYVVNKPFSAAGISLDSGRD